MLPTFDPGFSTVEMTRIFSPAEFVRHLLAFESALAAAGAEAGLVPAGVDGEIARACEAASPDPARVLGAGWEAGTPLIPLLDSLRQLISADAGRWLHHGATSQDAIDTAMSIQMRDGRDAIERHFSRIAGRLTDLAHRHRDLPAVGRTLLQPAEVTSFGLRCARWLEAVDRRIDSLLSLSFRVELAGAVGDLGRLGEAGPDIVRRLAERLDLTAPAWPNPSDRSQAFDTVASLLHGARTLAKISADLALLAALGEVRMRPGASSAIPDKRNPIDAVRAVAAADACGAVAHAVLAGRPVELERAAGGWQSEWFAVPLVFHTAAAAAEATAAAVDSLEIDEDAVRAGAGETAPPPAATALVDRLLREHGHFPI